MTLLSPAFALCAPEPTVVEPAVQQHPFAPGCFMARPVYGGQGLECDPKHELLSIVMVDDGVATPVDCVPLANLKTTDVNKAAERLTKAFHRALNRMDVQYIGNTRDQMAGWTITAQGADDKTHRLEFIREGFGEKRVREVLLSRAREHAHQDLKLESGPDYWAFCVRSLRPY